MILEGTGIPQTEANIKHIENDCCKPNWNGNDEKPVTSDVIDNVKKFLRLLPPGFWRPEVCPNPDGDVSMDWLNDKDHMLSISIGAGNKLAYAWLVFDGAKDAKKDSEGKETARNGVVFKKTGHGVITFNGLCIPQEVYQLIQKIETE
jgi:hypothetical protein